MDTVQQLQMKHPPGRRRHFMVIRWGAVLGGVAAGLAIQLMLTLLMMSTGITSGEITQSENSEGLNTFPWAGASLGIIVLASIFASGYFAARLSGLNRMSDAVLHGFATWAVSTLLFAWLATSTLGLLYGGVFASVSRVIAESSGAVTVLSGSVLTANAEAWWLFVAVALSLVLGMLGGAFAATAPDRLGHTSAPAY